MRESLHFNFWSKPFVGIAALLMGGIVAGRYVSTDPVLPVAALALAVLMLGWRGMRWAAIAVGIFALGAALYAGRYRVTSAEDLRLTLSGNPELVTVRGKLVDSPSLRELQVGTREMEYSYATIDLTDIRKARDQWRSAEGRVTTRLRGALSEEFFQGRHVEISGVVAFPAKAAAPGLFDYREYLYNSRIFFQLKSDSTNDWRLLSLETMPLTEQFRRWARVQLRRGVPENDESSKIIAAMTLGLRNTLSGEMADTFMRTGTMHIIAISGLHVACITTFLCLVLTTGAGLSRATGGLIALTLVWFYTVATGLQSSAVRSALMATVFIMSWVLRRPGDLLNSLAASAVLILLIQPEQLFQASFQLSFSVVLVIALALALVERHYPTASADFRRITLRLDPLLPYELAPRWKKCALWALGLLIGNFVISVAAWIGSMPLTAYYFNTVTPVSLLANLVAVPLSSIALAATVFSILAWPLAPLSNYVAWVAMTWTIKAVEFFSAFPFGYFYVPKPNGLFFIAYAAAVAVIFVPALQKGLRKYCCAVVIAALSVFWIGSVYAAKSLATLTALPCSGTPVLVQDGRDVLIDCASDRDADYMVKRYLRAKGLQSLDTLVVTHGDAQVVGGFEVISREFSPEQVFTSPVRMRSPGYRRMIRRLEKEGDRWRRIAAGEQVEGWSVLHPAREKRGFPRADDNAVVMKRRFGEWTIIHLSDLGPAGQEALLAKEDNLRADIVIAGMPEQGEPLSAALLSKIQPRVIVLGTAEYPYTAQGTPALRKRLAETGASIFYVNEEQAVSISIRANECVIESIEGRRVLLPKKTKEGG